MQGFIYRYICRETGSCYIGQTWDIETRRADHKRAKGGSPLFHKAIQKYGYDAFDFAVLRRDIRDQVELDKAEQEEILFHKSMSPHGYNLTAGGYGGRFSEESRLAASKASVKRFSDPEQRREMAEKIRQYHANPDNKKKMVGRVREAWNNNHEYRNKVLEAARKRKNDPEWKAKNAESLRRRRLSILCIETGKVYRGLEAAAKDAGVTASSISYNVKGKTRHAGGLRWRLATPEEAKRGRIE